MEKILKIDSCYECYYMDGIYCSNPKIKRYKFKEDHIPDWCPLEDAPDTRTIMCKGCEKRGNKSWHDNHKCSIFHTGD